jgi:AcrR family transcriptional regulator
MSSSITVRRTQAERTRASRAKIIEAATELFSQQGFRGAKMADIAKAANLTEPGLLHHFPSKTALLTAVLAERDRTNDERFHIYLAGEKQDLLASLLRLAEHNETVPGLVQLFTILAAESIQEQHPGHDFFLWRYEAVRAQGVAVLRQAQARGEVRVDLTAEDLIVMVFAMMDGLQIQWLYDSDRIDMARIFGQFVRLLKVESS